MPSKKDPRLGSQECQNNEPCEKWLKQFHLCVWQMVSQKFKTVEILRKKCLQNCQFFEKISSETFKHNEKALDGS